MRPFLALLVVSALPFAAFADGPTTVPVDPAKAYKHEPSGMTFPATVGDFVRGPVHAFDAELKDVAVAYNDKTVRIVITAYAYPAAGRGTLEEELKRVVEALVTRNPGAKQVAEGARTLHRGEREVTGKEVIYEVPPNGNNPALLSHAILFRNGSSSIKFRITYAKDLSETADRHIAAFLGGLTLPE